MITSKNEAVGEETLHAVGGNLYYYRVMESVGISSKNYNKTTMWTNNLTTEHTHICEKKNMCVCIHIYEVNIFKMHICFYVYWDNVHNKWDIE